VTVVDGRDGPLVIAVEPAENSTIDAIRKVADPVDQEFRLPLSGYPEKA